MDEPILFLTACVNPQGMCMTAVQDSEERLNMYLNAIRYYLDIFPYKILVVENTNTNICEQIAQIDKHQRVEFLTFQGNDYDKSLGKGYGEARIIKYAIENSSLLKEHEYIIKITGRHIVLNLAIILKFLGYKKFDVACLIQSKNKLALSDIFIVSKKFLLSYFLPFSDNINDTKGYYFEHCLFDAVRKGMKHHLRISTLPFYPSKEGVSGSTGKSFHRPSIWRQMKCLLNYFFDKL